jgi:hypothetical protein
MISIEAAKLVFSQINTEETINIRKSVLICVHLWKISYLFL